MGNFVGKIIINIFDVSLELLNNIYDSLRRWESMELCFFFWKLFIKMNFILKSLVVYRGKFWLFGKFR